MLIPIYRLTERSNKAKGRATAVEAAKAQVDDDRSDLLDHFWTLSPDGYAKTYIGGRQVFMHRLVLNTDAQGDVSHINANRLDNRRANLALGTRSANLLNTADPLSGANTSGFRGVTRDDRGRSLKRPWRGKVSVSRKTYQTRRYATPQEAAVALNELRARLGVPQDLRVREWPEVRRG